MNHEHIKTLTSTLRESLSNKSFASLSLGAYKGVEKDLKKILAKKITLKNGERLSFIYRYKTKDITKNYTIEDGISKIESELTNGFQSATLFTTNFDLIIEKNITKKSPTHTEIQTQTHDRTKTRLLSTINKQYLHDLGITDERGTVYKNAQDKFRQINKYIEIIDSLIKKIPKQKSLKIVDMGAGKGYLTFALYDHLTSNLNLNPVIVGVEYRSDLVDLCNNIAEKSGFRALSFTKGSIKEYDTCGTNILIALHACDTATDDAIAKGILAESDLIVVAPCCHKQIRGEMELSKKSNDLDFLLRHGIFLERQAEMVTDGIRSLILEYSGYNTKVFEFISDAQTPKNVMIVATKNKKAISHDPMILKKIQNAKEYFGISHHYLEKALKI